jgi:hypothetical protein
MVWNRREGVRSAMMGEVRVMDGFLTFVMSHSDTVRYQVVWHNKQENGSIVQSSFKTENARLLNGVTAQRYRVSQSHSVGQTRTEAQ